jgi:aerobic-type carbon monoxide dehydrogenase small subunit (CoxS/CutS family)
MWEGPLVTTTITFTVNGQVRTVVTDPQRPLLDVLREDLGLTGTKYGCGQGDCLACTVLIDGRAEPSCQTPVADVEGRSVLTIEGLADGDRLHPVQEAFLEADAMQCGYCTPGMIVALAGLLEAMPKASAGQILAQMDGHLCRCCGYERIVQAIRCLTSLEGVAP